MSTAEALVANEQTVAVGDRTLTLPVRCGYAEYLRLLAESPIKLEYVAGRVVAMAGGTVRSVDISTNLGGELRQALKDTDCKVTAENLRVAIDDSDFFPDVVVTCGPREFADRDANAVTNPTLLIEVLSPATERYDRTTKYDAYTALPSLREYVLVSQGEYRVERFVRDGDRWSLLVTIGREASVEFASVAASVPMAEIYRNVPMPDPDVAPDVNPEERIGASS